MNIIFFGNKKFKELLDNCWDSKNYVYYQIDNFKNSESASHIKGDIINEADSLIFIPYFLFSYLENEGNPELNNYIVRKIHSFPGKHVICMFTDLRCVDNSSIFFAYEGIANLLNELEDNYIYFDTYNYISINRNTKSWVEGLNNEINLSLNNISNQTEDLVIKKSGIQKIKK